MRIAIIDADLLDNGTHYPNLALMKISKYEQNQGNCTELILDYSDELFNFDKLYVSKVFTKTVVPEWVLNLPNVHKGGTGFYFDKAPKLPYDIEHSMPDYELYRPHVNRELSRGTKSTKLAYYTDYSIGFTTRGCVRGCDFCVNRNSRKVEKHSPLEEFHNLNSKKITLWDDNILAYPQWKEIFQELKDTGKPFKFQQGLDFRMLTREKMEFLKDVKYDGGFIFAFDNVNDKSLIIKNLKLWNEIVKKECRFYVFTGFENLDGVQDFHDLFERIEILMKYGHFPYIMRHENYVNSKWKSLYIQVARWCNQPSFFRNYSLHGFADINQKTVKKECSIKKTLREFGEEYPDLADKWFNLNLKEGIYYE